ncbi:MAG TPA: glycerate dehydrogenase [Clostridiales bacterium]|jgi:glycerate dehydrogenase|nr:glycerate dehydrogenase [Clostridiales bacterium]
MKIVVLDGYTLNPGDLTWDGFGEIGDIVVHDRVSYTLDGQEQVVEAVGDAEIVLTNKTPITREAIESMPKVKYIGVLATGYNVVDIKAAKERNITVTNIPTYGTFAVAQMTFALLLEICHHVGIHNEMVHDGFWNRNPDWCFWKYPLIELADKTLGIIGYGRIGRAVGQIGLAMGMKVLVHDQYITDGDTLENVQIVELDEIFRKSDVITLHCPLTEHNKGLINKTAIDKMKKSAIIINTSRGPLIVEQDLADALNSGRIYGAAVDVVSHEPIEADNPLLSAEKCIITPHISWAPKESRERLMQAAVENLVKYLEGNPVNVIN